MRLPEVKFSEPLLARVPDFSAEPARKQLAIGLVASVVVHLLIFLLFVVAVWLAPKHPGYDVQQDEPLEIEVVPLKNETEPEKLVLEEQKELEMLMSRGLQKSDKKPRNADFQSDQDMVAGSELPANGLQPLPTQDGRTDLPGMDFATQDVILGATDGAAGDLLHGPRGNDPQRPLFKPQPLTQAQIDAANEAEPNTALPKAASTPPPRFEERLRPTTPAPLRKVPAAADGEFVISAPKPATPAPKAEQEKRPEIVDAPVTRPAMATPPPQMAALSTPPPLSGGSPTKKFQEQLEKNQLEGNISNRGRAGVNAVGTPMATYLRRAGNMIESRWQIYVRDKREWIMTGTVRIRFAITEDGRTTDVAVEANESNRAFADVCAQAVRDSKLESLPPDAEPFLRNGKYEYAINFTLF